MKKDLLTYYVLDRLQTVEENLNAYRKEKKPEQLHILRVEIKKIRAALFFAGKVYKEKFRTDSLKPLFKKAGEIRELLINIHMMGKDPGPQARLITLLRKKEHLLQQQFIKDADDYTQKVKRFRASLHLPANLPEKKKVIRYFKRAIKKAKEELQQHDRESLHEFRKRLKAAMYAYHLLPGKLQHAVGLDEKYIDQLQEKTGNWHDTYAAIAFLSTLKLKSTDVWINRLRKKEQRQFDALHALHAGKSDFFR